MAEAGTPLKHVQIVPLAERHIGPVVEIEKASNSAPWSERSFRNELGHPDGIFLVMEGSGRPVGFAAGWVLADELHVINVAVDPAYRRAGHGRKLVVELLLHAQERGATCATLEVRAGNTAASRLYEALGFHSCGLRKNYYPDNKEDAVVMWMHGLDKWSPEG
ncbi:MAG: ribosomal protein S18-alanine N-acetyltransferase [Fimbriimonadaceae bacterium]|nr:ribosomal protein S18-alanine N-acetyltransferase [Fimbriimonadaceae bacterium]